MENKAQKIDFWQFTDEAKINVYNEVWKNINVSPKAAEKDWWVCHAIKAVFSLRCSDALTFKGGTSLSKAWDITRRFSEDVDISIDKSFFGIDGDTRSARDRIRKLSRKYIREEVMGELIATMRVFASNECDIAHPLRKDSDADPTVLLIPYKSILPADPYIKETIKIEFSCRNLREPREVRSIQPFAAELSPMIDFPETAVPTVTPTRTFLEKVFLLHEEFQKNYPRHKRMSRHLYDILMLDKAGYVDKAMADTELYRTLVQHRSTFNAIRGIDYSKHTPERLNIIPNDELLPLWEEDYKAMQDQFIYGDSPEFPQLIKAIREIQERLHGIRL